MNRRTVTASVGMGMLLVQRNVRVEVWDVCQGSVCVGRDMRVWGVCHVWGSGGMGLLFLVRSVRLEGMGVGVNVDVELDGM